MADKADRRTLRDWLRMVFRRRNLFLLGASLFALAVLIAAGFVPPRYSASAIFERTSDVPAVGRDRLDAFEAMKRTLRQDLLGRDAVVHALGEVGLMRNLPRDDENNLTAEGRARQQLLVRQTQQNLELDWEVSSDAIDRITVRFTHADPYLAQQIPNQIVRSYVDAASSEMLKQAGARAAYLKAQADDALARLDEKRRERLKFEEQYPDAIAVGFGASHMRLQLAISERDRTRRAMRNAQERIATLREHASIAPTSQATSGPTQVLNMPNPRRASLEEELWQTRRDLSVLRSVYGKLDGHPDVQALLKRIEQLQEQINDLPELAEYPIRTLGGSPDPLARQLAEAQNELRGLEQELQELDRRVQEHDDQFKAAVGQRDAYDRIVRDEDLLRREWERRKVQYEEAQDKVSALASGHGTSVRQTQTAEYPFRPSYPTLFMIFAVAIVGGVGCGAGLVFLRNAMDRSVLTSEEAVRQFNTQVYGVIGEIVTPAERRRRRWRRWTFGPLATVVVLTALAAATTHDVLWLRDRKGYERWKADPLGYVYEQTVTPAMQWFNRLKA